MRSHDLVKTIVFSLLAIAFHAVAGVAYASDTPADVVSKLILAGTRGRTSDMYNCFALSTNVPPEYINDKIEEMAQAFSAPGFVAETIRTFAISNCAIVGISTKEGPAGGSRNIGGFSLVRRNDKWLILPEGDENSVKRPINGLNESEVASFMRLLAIFRVFRSAAMRAPNIVSPKGSSNKFVGTWSNGKEEFSTVGFSLRHDGGGIFATAIGATWLCWTNVGDSITLTVGDQKVTTNIVLHYDAVNELLEFTNPDGKNEMLLLRVDTNEPPDVGSMQIRREAEGKAEARREAKRRQEEKLIREEPEYQRILQSIKEDPKIVLSDTNFYSREDTPSTRAFRASLGNHELHFEDKILAKLLDRLPPDNHWSRVQIFSRPELTSSTIERFYPQALYWGAHLNYSILVNIATHSNTPRHIVEDIAERKDLPVGATYPAREQLKKLKAQDERIKANQSLESEKK